MVKNVLNTFLDRIERDCVAKVSSVRADSFVTRKLFPRLITIISYTNSSL